MLFFKLIHAFLFISGALTFDEAGQAHLRGARKATPVMNSTESKFNPTPAATLAAAAVAAPMAAEVARKRTPSLPRREPSPELGQENGGQVNIFIFCEKLYQNRALIWTR